MTSGDIIELLEKVLREYQARLGVRDLLGVGLRPVPYEGEEPEPGETAPALVITTRRPSGAPEVWQISANDVMSMENREARVLAVQDCEEAATWYDASPDLSTLRFLKSYVVPKAKTVPTPPPKPDGKVAYTVVFHSPEWNGGEMFTQQVTAGSAFEAVVAAVMAGQALRAGAIAPGLSDQVYWWLHQVPWDATVLDGDRPVPVVSPGKRLTELEEQEKDLNDAMGVLDVLLRPWSKNESQQPVGLLFYLRGFYESRLKEVAAQIKAVDTYHRDRLQRGENLNKTLLPLG